MCLLKIDVAAGLKSFDVSIPNLSVNLIVTYQVCESLNKLGGKKMVFPLCFFSYLEFADSLVQNISPGTKMEYNRNFRKKKGAKTGLSSAKSKYKLFNQ